MGILPFFTTSASFAEQVIQGLTLLGDFPRHAAQLDFVQANSTSP